MHAKSIKKPAKPAVGEMVEALRYRLAISAIAEYLDRIGLPEPSHHLALACREIDRVWEEGRFELR